MNEIEQTTDSTCKELLSLGESMRTLYWALHKASGKHTYASPSEQMKDMARLGQLAQAVNKLLETGQAFYEVQKIAGDFEIEPVPETAEPIK